MGSVDEVGSVGEVTKTLPWLVWLVWVHKILVWVKKLAPVKILGWQTCVGIFTWVAWVSYRHQKIHRKSPVPDPSKSFSQIITVNLQYHDIKITKQCSDVNCVKIVRIWGLSGSYYATLWVNTGTYSETLHVQYKWRKNLHQKKTTNTNVYVSWSVTVALERNVHLTAKGRCDIQV